MFDLAKAKAELEQISQRLACEQNLDNNERSRLQKEAFELSRKVEKAEVVVMLEQELVECDQILNGDDEEMAELAAEERVNLVSDLNDAQAELNELLFPPDPNDSRSVFLEIRPAAGGQEASLFVADIFKMYSGYALSKGWKVTVNSFATTDVGGAREIIAYISGRGVFGELKHESGVHRVQRVPTTEAAGRIHTSTATVIVIPEAEDVEVSIDPNDVRTDVFRASGAGGQHVNTTDSAVRLTHVPTGLVVTCQDERSQLKNKNKAMKELRARLYAIEQEKQEQEASSERKSKMGTGDRSEKIRTYNYPQNRITDHRIGLTLKKLDIIMQGDLEDIISALKKQDGLTQE